MSNPGVIILSETLTDRGESFRVEDNIGEAIHIHFGSVRFDLTVEDFLVLSSIAQQSLTELIEIDGFSAEHFDPRFLASIADGFDDLLSVDVESISLGKLMVYTDSWFGMRLRSLGYSRMYRAILGETDSYLRYRQENYFGQTNLERLDSVLEAVRQNGYPINGQHIVLFNNQDIIRDGQHRAAALLYLHGDIEIPIVRMWFRENRHSLPRFPLLTTFPTYLFRHLMTRATGIYRKGRRLAGNVLRSLGLR